MSNEALPDVDSSIPIPRRILHDFGFFGHYLHVEHGGRSGKQHILIKLLKGGGQMSQRELLDNTCISSAALSEVVTKLETAGLITRERSDFDRRQQVLKLTDAGIKRATQLRENKRAFEAEALSCLNDQETLQLLELLDRIVSHWNTLERGRSDA